VSALALGILSWLCVNRHKPQIEADLQGRALAELQKLGIGFAAPAKVTVQDRRVVRLVGYEGSREISDEAQRTARAVWGVADVEVEAIPLPKAVKAQKEITEVLKLDIVEFITGSAQLTPAGRATLDKVAGILSQVTEPVGITGHTDNRGLREANMDLSRRRAESVKAYLVTKGIAAERLTTSGAGPDQPVASNDTDEGRQRNRRIEFSLKEVMVKKTI
jgi:outer membrane protein OmpA-like peptidoglycan-associated protein